MKIIVKCFSASNLGGNPYYNYLISAAVEIPGEIAVLCIHLYLSVVFVQGVFLTGTPLKS